MTAGTGIIFLQKDKFDFYSPGLIKIIEFRFVPEIIRDQEIINAELLENLIKIFVDNNKIIPSELVIVLSDNASFIKDFVSPPSAPTLPVGVSPSAQPQVVNNESSEKVQEDIKAFIDHVPFENVLSRNFPMQNGTKVLAVNKDFYVAIKNAFEKVGFKVSAVYPGVVFSNNIGAKPVMDIIVANIILQQAPNLRDDNLLKENKIIEPIVSEEKKEGEGEKDFVVQDTDDKPKKTNKKRLILMIGIFAILLIVLVLVYLGSLSQPQY